MVGAGVGSSVCLSSAGFGLLEETAAGCLAQRGCDLVLVSNLTTRWLYSSARRGAADARASGEGVIN